MILVYLLSTAILSKVPCLAWKICKNCFLFLVNSYPETRHRYWNGYMLFYESADKLRAMNGSGNDGRLLVRQEPVMEGQRFESKNVL